MGVRDPPKFEFRPASSGEVHTFFYKGADLLLLCSCSWSW
jgi:hypothetical protein